jgi:hypothetical protein
MQKLFLLLLLFQVANYEKALLQISFLATTTIDQIPQNPPKILRRKTQPTKNSTKKNPTYQKFFPKKKPLITKKSSEKNPTPSRIPPTKNTQSPQ